MNSTEFSFGGRGRKKCLLITWFNLFSTERASVSMTPEMEMLLMKKVNKIIIITGKTKANTTRAKNEEKNQRRLLKEIEYYDFNLATLLIIFQAINFVLLRSYHLLCRYSARGMSYINLRKRISNFLSNFPTSYAIDFFEHFCTIFSLAKCFEFMAEHE